MKKICFLSVLLATGIFALWFISCSSGDADAPTVDAIESAVDGYAFDNALVPRSQFDSPDLSQFTKLAEAAEGDAEEGYAAENDSEDDDEYYDEEYEDDVDDDETYYEDVESDDEEGGEAQSDDEDAEYDEDEGTGDDLQEDEPGEDIEDESFEDYEAGENSILLF